MRTIRLGNGRVVSLSAYCRAWREVNAARDDQEFSHGLCGWAPETAARIRQEFVDGLNHRISLHLSWYREGRRWDQDWQRVASLDAKRINSQRLVVRASEITTDDWRKRFAHRFEW